MYKTQKKFQQLLELKNNIHSSKNEIVGFFFLKMQMYLKENGTQLWGAVPWSLWVNISHSIKLQPTVRTNDDFETKNLEFLL